MVIMKRRSFLDNRKKRMQRFKLNDVDEPNLFREFFPYEEVCRTEFDHRVELIDPPEEIFISDTTFRDGQQARPPYTVQQMIDLYDMLHRLGGPNGVIRQTEFFLYSDKDKEAVQLCLEKGYRDTASERAYREGKNKEGSYPRSFKKHATQSVGNGS